MPAWKQTSSGLAVDLNAPDLSRIDVRRDIAEPLARIARFSGHLGRAGRGGRFWSVAQHCVVGAKALAEEAGPTAGLAFLLHDAHEAFLGDQTSPFVIALQNEAESVFGREAAERIREALARLKHRLDDAIYSLAGWTETRPLSILRQVADMDLRMLDTERRHLLGEPQAPVRAEEIWPAAVLASRPVRTHGALTPWPEKRAADEWMALWEAWRLRPERAPLAATHPIPSTHHRAAAAA